MKNHMRISYILVLSLLTILPSIAQSAEYEVKHAGALKNFKMRGDISAKYDLKNLEGKKGLYALGAFENLKGEIQIFDGKPYSSYVSEGKLIFDTSFKRKSSLLVYAEVNSWQKFLIPHNISTHAKLEEFISKLAKKSGIDTEKPFPFLISGKVKSVFWHVIDWDAKDKVHSHQKHIESGLNGNIENTHVDILGFYSFKHKGIFTHHTSNMHMHFITKDKTLAGHVDRLTPGKEMQIKLPIVK